MSHDRGCFCGREKYEYQSCPDESCSNKPSATIDNENDEKILKIAYDGVSSLLLEVQQECIELRKENERLREKCDKQAMILRRLAPENFPDTLFIHTVLGEKDQNGMPEKLLVVPSYGCDFSYVYERTDKITGPEW